MLCYGKPWLNEAALQAAGRWIGIRLLGTLQHDLKLNQES